MSPATLAKLQSFIDGQRVCVGDGVHRVVSKAYRPHYRCPLVFFKQMQAWDRSIDEAINGVYSWVGGDLS